MATARAASRVLVLDCCFSGQAIGLMTSDTSVVSGRLEVSGTCTSPPRSRTGRPTPCRPRGYTAYTGEPLDLLHRGSGDAAEFLTLLGIHEHLARALPAKGRPCPEWGNTRTVGRPTSARNLAYTDTVDPAAIVEEVTRLERMGELGDVAHRYRLAAEAGHTDGMLRMLTLRGGHHAGRTVVASSGGGRGSRHDERPGCPGMAHGGPPADEGTVRQGPDAGLDEARDNLRTLLRQRGQSAW
ncbi:hypothetical protein ACIRQY_22790 [Streptomyces sp. NPDC101490]|uniref:hypothetical protein n=1 Tax=Streptomyces sp. NPDC101490 TaxID=3366143 RepID=UPI0037FDED7E